MLTRRGFLKGFLASVAAAALVKNGVIQPERRIFDMAANTWRDQITATAFRFERVTASCPWPGMIEWDAYVDGVFRFKVSRQKPYLAPWLWRPKPHGRHDVNAVVSRRVLEALLPHSSEFVATNESPVIVRLQSLRAL